MAHALCLEPVQIATVTAIAEFRPQIPLDSVLQIEAPQGSDSNPFVRVTTMKKNSTLF